MGFGAIASAVGAVSGIAGSLLGGLDQRRANNRLINTLENAQSGVIERNELRREEIRGILGQVISNADTLGGDLLADVERLRTRTRGIFDAVLRSQRRDITEAGERAEGQIINRFGSKFGSNSTVLASLLNRQQLTEQRALRDAALGVAGQRVAQENALTSATASARTAGFDAGNQARTKLAAFIEGTQETIADTPQGVSAGIPRQGVVGVLGGALAGNAGNITRGTGALGSLFGGGGNPQSAGSNPTALQGNQVQGQPIASGSQLANLTSALQLASVVPSLLG